MVRLFWYLRGYAVLELCGAAPGWALNGLTKARIPFWDVTWIDPLTVRIRVFLKDQQAARTTVARAQCDCKICGQYGIRWSLHGLAHRPVLLIMMALTALAAVLLPQFVLFYEVSGNETVPSEQILREVEAMGVGFGRYGPSIRPAWVKNRLLNRLPQLQWVTVTQNGCRAQIVVRERPETPQTDSRKGFANVIATRSGMITHQSVLAGQAQFQVGDMVSRGDVLVSGIVDLERIYVIERARAEIFAKTWYEKQLVIPQTYTQKAAQSGRKICVWLVIGHRRIKIFGNSGISYGSCDKMITIKELQLPQQLTLPVSLEIETFRFYEPATARLEQEQAEKLLSDYVLRTVRAQMQAGQVLEQTGTLDAQDGCWQLSAHLTCEEMIAQAVEAKWKNEDFVND